MTTKRVRSSLLAGSLSTIAAAIAATAAAPAPVAATETPTHLAQAARNPCGPSSPCAPGRGPAVRGSPCGPASSGQGAASSCAPASSRGRPAAAPCGPSAPRGPASAAENWPDSFGAYVAQVRKTIKTTDMDGYLAVVKNPNGALLIDVREDSEYKAGHVPGSVNIPRGLLEFQIWKKLDYPKAVDMEKKIYVQCRTGGRATLAAADLKRIGFTNVTAVIMDIQDWEKKGNPIEK